MSGINSVILSTGLRAFIFQTRFTSCSKKPFGLKVLLELFDKNLKDILLAMLRKTSWCNAIGGSGTWDATHNSNCNLMMMAFIEI